MLNRIFECFPLEIFQHLAFSNSFKPKVMNRFNYFLKTASMGLRGSIDFFSELEDGPPIEGSEYPNAPKKAVQENGTEWVRTLRQRSERG